jgi:hypothetical protein
MFPTKVDHEQLVGAKPLVLSLSKHSRVAEEAGFIVIVITYLPVCFSYNEVKIDL